VKAANRRKVARLPIWGRAHEVAGRLGWGVADQAISSLTNFIVGICVARSLGPNQFGAFSIAFATYLIALNASRGLATDALLVRYSGADLPAWRAAVAGSTGTALAVGIVAGIACVLAGIVIASPTGLALVALGLTSPGLLLQDSWRFAFFAAGRAGRAFANDLLWGAAVLVLLAVVIASGRSSQFSFMLAWGSAATIAALFGAAQTRLLPRVTRARRWLRSHRDLSGRYLIENLSVVGGNQLKFYGLGAIAGLAAVGALRAAELLFGPVFVLTLGIGLMAVPEAVRLLRVSAQRLLRFCLVMAVVGASAAIIWGTALLLLPDRLGQVVLGPTWRPASALIVPTTLELAAIGIQIGAWAGLRALAAASRSLRSQGFSSMAYLIGTVSGGVAGGTRGAAWGIAGAGVFSAAFWWWQILLGLRDFQQSGSPPIAPYYE
jgi:O-antigen/teichoic acid export membrane protein